MNVQNEIHHAARPTGGIARRTFRVHGLLMAVALLVALIAPLASSPSGALALQDGDTGNGGIGVTPVIQETPVAEEPPVAEETPVPVTEETPVAEETTGEGITSLQTDPYAGRIIVFIRECADPYGNDFTRLDANCRGLEGHGFEVYGVDNAGQGLQRNATSYVAIDGVGGGQYTIRSFTPADYRSPSVFCSRGAYGSPQGTYNATVTVDGYHEFALAPGERIACHWFYVPKVIGYGSLKVGVSVCPPVAEIPIPFDYATASVSDLANVCSIYRDGRVQFLLYAHADGKNTYETTDPNNDAIAYWSAMAAGGQTLSTEPWAGYGTPRVACSDDQSTVYEVGVQGWEAELELRKDVRAICDWWIIPGAEQQVVLGGAVSITRHTCDSIAGNIDPYSAGRKLLLEQCQPGADARNTFDLFTGSSGEAPVALSGIGDNSVTWRDIPAGDLTVTGVDGDGYGDPVLFCAAENSSLLVFESVYEEVRVVDGAFGYNLAKNVSLTCDWFAIPATGGGAVADGEDGEDGDVNDAPNGDSPDVDGDEDGDVTDPKDDDVSDAQDRNKDQNEDQNEDGQDGGLGVAIDRIPDNTGNGAPTPSGATGSITIYEWLCPAGFDITAADASPWLDCAVATEGAEIAITGPDGFAAEQASGDSLPGGVRWDNLGAGDYQIDDTRPDAAAAGFVLACHGVAAPAAYPLYSTGSGAPLTISIGEGQQAACLWFTVPAAD